MCHHHHRPEGWRTGACSGLSRRRRCDAGPRSTQTCASSPRHPPARHGPPHSQTAQGTLLLLQARKAAGACSGVCRNSYWRATLFSVRGRAVPWAPLGIYAAYTVAVTALALTTSIAAAHGGALERLNSVTTAVGVALFLLLSFRNNAAFQRWQAGADRFKNFCSLAKSAARAVAGSLQSFVEIGGAEEGHDLVLARITWLMVALEVRARARGFCDHMCCVCVCVFAVQCSAVQCSAVQCG